MAPAVPPTTLPDVGALLNRGALGVEFQPLVRLADRAVVGYEALVRPPGLRPEQFLAAAARSGLRAEAEAACWRAAARAGPPPGGVPLFLNVNPHVLRHAGFAEAAEELPDRIVLELTERSNVADFERLRRNLAPWRARGAGVAIDDMGAGHSALRHVVELEPEWIKLAETLVSGVHLHPRRRALVRALVALAEELGATIVAEGVEDEQDLEALESLGVPCAQGFVLARPGPAWPEPLSARAAEVPGLFAAATVKEACDVVVGLFSGRPNLLPSLYLAHGEVLRCAALTGYWQLLDGMPPGAGVIGTTYARGEPMVIADVGDAAEYLEAAADVKSEACVPIRMGGEVVGVLNIESYTPLPSSLVAEMTSACAALGDRMAALGGLEEETPHERLTRHASGLAGLVDVDDITDRVLEAARDVARMESALLARGDAVLRICGATGPQAEQLRHVGEEELAQVAGWVEGVRSCYTRGDTGRRGFAGHEAFRDAGTEALVVLPLLGPQGREGILVLADRTPLELDSELVELLELLAMQAASALRTAEAVIALEQRAARDPLTGLGHHATFHQALVDQRRLVPADRSVAVVMADIDGFKEVNDTRGHTVGDDILRRVADALAGAMRVGDEVFRVGGDELAAVLQVGSEEEAAAIGERLEAAVRDDGGVSVSLGVAVARPEEDEQTAVARADHAMYERKRGARADGQAGSLASDAQR